jgi:hypothetical protein
MKTRKSSLPPRTTRLARSTAPIAKRGPAKARREKTYKAFMASAAWKKIRAAAAIERAGHRCEVMEDVEFRVGGTQQTQRIAFRCDDRPHRAPQDLRPVRRQGTAGGFGGAVPCAPQPPPCVTRQTDRARFP